MKWCNSVSEEKKNMLTRNPQLTSNRQSLIRALIVLAFEFKKKKLNLTFFILAVTC